MASAVAQLEADLQHLLTLKPPGVSGSKIMNITALCVANVQSESVLVQKLFTHFKKTPGSHKLGVLYVVDSVTRKWLEQAKAQGQLPISLSAPDGTFAAGVHRVTELMPTLMNDIIATAPPEQKEKLEKLIQIWDKGNTFPPPMLESFKKKMNVQGQTTKSTTPPGSPPANVLASLGLGSRQPAQAPAQAPPQSSAQVPNILETLANIARQNAPTTQSNHSNTTAPAPVPAPAPAPTSVTVPTSATLFGSNAPGIPASGGTAQTAPAYAYGQTSMPYFPVSQPTAPPVNVPVLPFPYPAPSAVPPQLAAPAVPTPAPAATSALTTQLVAALATAGYSLEQIASVVASMSAQGSTAPQNLPPQPLPQMPQPVQTAYGFPPPSGANGPAHWEAPGPDDSRDRNGFQNGMRSPNRHRGRSRSRSPGRWDHRDSPRSRRDDRGYDYGQPASPDRGYDDRDRNGGRARMNDYRQRSPVGRRGESPEDQEPRQGEKWVEYDNTIPSGSIKVYSRTLFVGGVTMSDRQLHDIFSRFGPVQSCIVQKEKRHAFVKMYFRRDAAKAKTAMESEQARNHDHQLRTRWGVGFGPRDCSDYASGISIIPIHKLTDADRKWMLTAKWGGSGGKPIVSGLCVEEPDIEIGTGVSSKAISRRMQTDKGGSHGPKSTKREDDSNHHGGGPSNHYGGGGSSGGGNNGGGGGGGGRWRNKDKHRGGSHDNNTNNNRRDQGGDEPIVMGLPAGVTIGPNGPNLNFGAAATRS